MKTIRYIICILSSVLFVGCAQIAPKSQINTFLNEMDEMSFDSLRSKGPTIFKKGSFIPDHAVVFQKYQYTDFSDPEPELNRLREYDLMRRKGSQQTDIVFMTLVRETGEIIEFSVMGLTEPVKSEELPPPSNTVKAFTEAAAVEDADLCLALCTKKGDMKRMVELCAKCHDLKTFGGPIKIGNTILGKDKFKEKAIVNYSKYNSRLRHNDEFSYLLIYSQEENRWLLSYCESRNFQNFPDFLNIPLFKSLALNMWFYARKHNGSYPHKLEDIKSMMKAQYRNNPKFRFVWIDPESQKELPLQYFPGYNKDKDESKVLVAAPKPYKGKRRCIIVGERKPKVIAEDEYQNLVKQSK